MNVRKLIHSMLEIIPLEAYSLKRQLNEIQREMLYTDEVRGWDAVMYVIGQEIPYPPSKDWHFSVLNLYSGLNKEDIKSLYIMN